MADGSLELWLGIQARPPHSHGRYETFIPLHFLVCAIRTPPSKSGCMKIKKSKAFETLNTIARTQGVPKQRGNFPNMQQNKEAKGEQVR